MRTSATFPWGGKVCCARLRIVAGRFGGRRIAPPPTDATRPILDRVREAMFSTLGDKVDDARVLDLFAGTGACGIEALSRGASFARFVERDAETRRELLANIQLLEICGESEVLGGDALGQRARETPARFMVEPEPVTPAVPGTADTRWLDIGLIDPPYPLWKELAQRKRILATLEELLTHCARPGAVLVLHSHPRDVAERELRFAQAIDARDYNNSRLWYLT
jgi:16S rRNA (guanine966-N2)-methyltransferase